MTTTTQKEQISEASEHISASKASDGNGWIYYANETSEWFRLTDADLVDLYDMLHHSDEEIRTSAYSHWCAGTPGELIGDDDAAKAAGLI